MTIKYTIQTSRETAILFFEREYGTVTADRLSKKIKCTNGLYDITPYLMALGVQKNKAGCYYFKTKKSASYAVGVVDRSAAYSAGKLGKSTIGHASIECHF